MIERPSDDQVAMIKVLLADDQAIIREAFAALLRLEADLEVVGQAATCAAAVDVARADRS